jgi:hypothetical protein
MKKDTIMEPRLKSSLKWTTFPKEFIKQIDGIVAESFQKLSPNAKFFIDGRIFAQEVLFKLGFMKEGSIIQSNIWVSADYDTKKDNVKNTINLAIDCGGSLLAHHIENPDEEFPRDWSEFDFNKKKVFICLDKSNDDLEAQANALLGELEDDVLVQEIPSEDDQDV